MTPDRSRAWAWCIRRRYAIEAVADALTWTVALAAATVLRHDFDVDRVDWTGLAALAPIATMAQIVAGLSSGLYLGRWRYGSFEEVAALARATGVATVVALGTDLWVRNPRLVPVSAVVGAGVGAFVLMGGLRYGWRLGLERSRRPDGADARRVLVFGAGDAGAQVVRSMLHDRSGRYLPVGLLDDDATKRNLRIMGVPVLGTRAALADVARTLGAEELLVAIPSATGELVGELLALGRGAGLPVKVLPTVSELIGGRVTVGDIRDVTEADLLGRREIETDIDAIAGYITGRRVLVTGAGGSIGAELCRQVWRFAPAELVMLDRDESTLHGVQLLLEGRALLDSPSLVLADIRDGAALERVFREHRPDVVFHAAALKHLVLLERHPAEAVKANVWGTLNVLRATAAAGAQRFVNISTDKAADPCSVLGWSKRIAERLTAHFAASSGGTYLSVRFGNVLGSRGSVLAAFHAQIAAGGPVTVTDPEVTRYFMTVQEAVELVIQAGAIGSGGDALVLDMGAPVRIADLARHLIARADRPVDVVYTGLRAGEKLHEVLLGSGEADRRPVHPLISHVAVPPLDPAAVAALDLDAPSLAAELAALASSPAPAGAVEPE